MAQKTLVQLVDDIDGTVIADGEGRTVNFSLNGVSYEIDLSDAHVAELTDALAPFISAGRMSGRSSSSRSAGPKSDPAELQKIREWARSNGHEVSDRGRVSGAVRDAYNAAN
jgi:hypothetical protein